MADQEKAQRIETKPGTLPINQKTLDSACEAMSESHSLQQCLSKSVAQYREILAQLQLIKTALSSSTINLAELVQNLNQQQVAACQHDEELLALLAQADRGVARHPLYLQRIDLIEQVLQMNNLLLPSIDGMMAVISNELTEIRNGRAVMGGYKQLSPKQGRIVKSSV